MSNQVGTVNCAHQGCVCTISKDFAYQRDGKVYCDAGCADGKGCGHPDCSCGRTSAPLGDRPVD